MLRLLLVSLLWAFSFGLIKVSFAELPPAVLAFTRLLIALPCFLPFCILLPRKVAPAAIAQLLLIGAVQYGLMYLALFSSFKYLSGYEVAVLTVFTPIYVVAAHGLLNWRMPPLWFWTAAILAIIGALVIFKPSSLPDKWTGIALVQASNICFAAGQIAYRHWHQRQGGFSDLQVFGWLYLGAVIVSAAVAAFYQPLASWAQLQPSQWLALIYLGAIASGLGFFLWNSGATRVGPATLAVFNNLKIPVAVVVSIVVFGETAAPLPLLAGLSILMAAFLWAEWRRRSAATN